ncbi:hypothetical protein GCM10028791_32420 [Echinicola sediminis]
MSKENYHQFFNPTILGKTQEGEVPLQVLFEIQNSYLREGNATKAVDEFLQLMLKQAGCAVSFVVFIDSAQRKIVDIRKCISEWYDILPGNRYLENLLQVEFRDPIKGTEFRFNNPFGLELEIRENKSFPNYAMMGLEIGRGNEIVLGMLNVTEVLTNELTRFLEPIASSLGMIARLEDCFRKPVADKKESKQVKGKRVKGVNVNPSNAVVSVFDKDWSPIYFSPNLENVLGYKPEEFIDMCQSKGGGEKSKILDKTTEGELDKYLCQVKSKSGETLTIETMVNAAFFNKGDAEIYVGVSKKVADRKVSNLTFSKRESPQERKELDFFSITSHEFKTPLSTIKSSVEICNIELQKRWNEIPGKEKFKKHFARVDNEVNRMNALLLNLLSLEKMKLGLQDLKLKQKNAFSFFSTILENWIEEDLIQFQADIAESLQIELDVDLTRQIISNLVENALKYGGGVQKPRVKLISREGRFMVCVEDFGEGIPVKDQKNIFKPFYRASNSNKYQKGSGLGLMISKKFAEMQNGKIYFESKVGEGTCFYLEFGVLSL